ncbi:ABC-2 type transporter [Halovivax asiaticus JCM 14624]|uniref:ABC-2 type transporter n=1 Tax=Halovivax asiaticus JCM 14624 TaxID=1227490 RepID=M0BGE0_9EURY|nr:ABC transporter permease subunit [Halovivax asiaticus]ELZ09920.1 ABC-2 type transporter [Halovivax asiaticus JCM 14624]
MSYAAVAKKDFQDGIRSKLLWMLMALFIVSIAGFALWAVLQNTDVGGSGDGEAGLAFGFAYVLSILFLVPVTGLVVSIKSIVRERELGSLKILLSLPHTRGEVIAGKFLGRTGLLTTAILAGYLPAALLFGFGVDNFKMLDFVGFTVVTVLFGIMFVAVGIGASALTKTETQATVAGFVVFIAMYTWNLVFGRVNSTLDLLSGNALSFVERFWMFNLYADMSTAIASLWTDTDSASVVVFNSTTSQPFYLQHWFAFVILALWIVVPLAIGYWRFERADL